MDTQIIDTQYGRVLPRDLFNEAKLLKCMGRLCLLIEDNMTPIDMTIDEYATDGEEGFKIGLADDGALSIANLVITIKGAPYLFKTTYNSKDNFPFFVEHNYCEYRVFDEKGDWDNEFINFIQTLQ